MDTVEKAIEDALVMGNPMVSAPRGSIEAAACAAISAHESALAESGLVIVPREPTPEMTAAGVEGWIEEKNAGYIYRSMLDAAPKSTAETS